MTHIQGRIIKGVGGLYTVSSEGSNYQCKARGVFRNRSITPLVGDNVLVQLIDNQKLTGNIVDIMERRNELLRPKIANIDQVAVVIAVKSPKINFDMLNRLIVLIENEDMGIIICVNKTDLDNGSASELKNIFKNTGYKIITVSAIESTGIDKLSTMLENKVTVFAGASGVGKSSIINGIISDAAMETGELSGKIDRGKHTTRHAQLLEYCGGYIADSPGFTSLALDHINIERLPLLFREFKPHLDSCRFGNCSHVKEEDCGVKKQVGKDINEQRYEAYVNIYTMLKNSR